MLSEPRALLFQTELLLPPIPQLKISSERVRKLYNNLHETAGHRYKNIELDGDTPTLSSKKDDEVVSTCRFESHSVIITEKRPEFGVDDFIEIVRRVLGGLGQLSPIYSQRCRIQCCSSASHNALHLLAGKVANVYEKIEPFDRPPSQFGIKFRFPPTTVELVDDEDETEDPAEVSDGDEDSGHEPTATETIDFRGDVTLRIETQPRDEKQVWMEVAVSHVFDGVRSVPDNLNEIVENISDAYNFLTEKGKNFLDQFDQDEPEGRGGA